MLDRLAEIKKRHEELERLMSDPEVINDPNKLKEYSKEHASLEEIVKTYQNYQETKQELEEAKEMLNENQEDDMEDFLKDEIPRLEKEVEKLYESLKLQLVPKDPNDDKNVFVEIRAGAGGDEAALFAGDLYRMYTRFAERMGWKTEIIETHDKDAGGFKEVIFMIKGKGAYSKLKFESGVHRVQRVPSTESSGRIHTSTATVAVLPEAEDVEIEISQNELRIDTFCATGPGGQSVNTTQSAVRITHEPTGIVVSCQDEKSQHKNRDKAMRVLRARLYDKYLEEQQQEEAEERKSQVGSGDRSERIRTYNFPQGRITDHRINLTVHKLEYVLDGELDELVESLITTYQAEKLKEVGA
ncbi:peptide chain release factor 1 [Natranaerobius trueperi]|uniref:Peptide chain release factor 1 n=1 Tax=Natranaerobius trueperi TaxID=759412 RepID=A0A226C2G8_9FIRM|nr:peptide chain release factor 1 [Natranaerobius trueperi]OWZ84580.1 peptide chain release factor 1 [Natranaerobius trueperi]